MGDVKHNKVKNALIKKGFVIHTGKHLYFNLVVNGEQTDITTHLSHSNKPLREPLLHAMSKDMHLNKKQFLSFVDCPYTMEKYVEDLKTKNLI